MKIPVKVFEGNQIYIVNRQDTFHCPMHRCGYKTSNKATCIGHVQLLHDQPISKAIELVNKSNR